ncbi:MAG TPA: molybdate ABC transporter substrate-binding protein [Candidatus Eisenbacteria bacterium]
MIRVAAAASLAGGFGEIAQLYERQHPGVTVQLDLAGSQQLAAQIEQGARADVFASADERWMNYARDRGLLAGAATEFVRNRLVLIVPRTNPARIRRLQDLARRGIRLVIAADVVPVGHYARVVLANLARDPAFGDDFARRVLANVVSEEENVRAVVGRVQLGEADAGIVYRSDVTPSITRYVTQIEIPDSANVLASYPIAVLKDAPRPDDARAFVDLVLSAEGQRILARWGFIAVGLDTAR